LKGSEFRTWGPVVAIVKDVLRDIQHGHVVAHEVVHLDELVYHMSIGFEPLMLKGLGCSRSLLGVRLQHPEEKIYSWLRDLV